MPLPRIIPERHRKLVRELLTFGSVGAANTGVGQLIFNGLLKLGPSAALVISTVIATIMSYVLNRHITYRHRPRTSVRRELPLFATFNLMGLFLQLGVLNLSRHVFGIPDTDHLGLNLARFGGAAVGTVFLLLTYRTFVFKAAPAVDPATDFGIVTAAIPAPSTSSESARSSESATEFAELTEPLEGELADDLPAEIADELLDDEPAITGAL